MPGLALLLLLLCCWGQGQCGASEEEARSAPLSQLRSQISSVEELLEEFRKQLQQQGEPDLHRLQGEPLSPGHAPDMHRLQGEPPSLGHVQGIHRIQGEPLRPGEGQGIKQPQSPGDAQGLQHQPDILSIGAAHQQQQQGDLQSPGDEQGLHHLQQLQDEERQQQDREGCESHFTALQDYIIRTKDSMGAGATFLMAPGGVLSWRQCLGACCAEPRCSTAVVELSSSSGHQGEPALSCYLFDCLYRGSSVCTFSLHRGYSSFTRSPDSANTPHQREPTGNFQQSLTLTAEKEESDEPPHSNAGQDVVLQLPTDWVVLDGRESKDDHGIIRYEWNLLHGDPSVDMKVPQPGTLQLSHLQEGAYSFQLTVTDTAGERSSDNITVTVLPKERHGVGCTGSCSRYQFACDDGCCIDITLACDRVVQCPDGSDEAFCQNFGPDRNTVTHAVGSIAHQKTMGLSKDADKDLQVENDQRINVEKKPLVSLDADKSKQLGAQEINESDDRFIPEHCLGPSVVGPCKGLFPRWYFDVSSGTCMHFFYGGCKGNENNFLQEADCLSECLDIHALVPKDTATESPSHTVVPPDHGSSGIMVEDNTNNGKSNSKYNLAEGGHPVPETGAVLPLALGLAITALLLLMVVCRLRLVRQKLKKARPMTSEESDYLINGMYL